MLLAFTLWLLFAIAYDTAGVLVGLLPAAGAFAAALAFRFAAHSYSVAATLGGAVAVSAVCARRLDRQWHGTGVAAAAVAVDTFLLRRAGLGVEATTGRQRGRASPSSDGALPTAVQQRERAAIAALLQSAEAAKAEAFAPAPWRKTPPLQPVRASTPTEAVQRQNAGRGSAPPRSAYPPRAPVAPPPKGPPPRPPGPSTKLLQPLVETTQPPPKPQPQMQQHPQQNLQQPQQYVRQPQPQQPHPVPSLEGPTRPQPLLRPSGGSLLSVQVDDTSEGSPTPSPSGLTSGPQRRSAWNPSQPRDEAAASQAELVAELVASGLLEPDGSPSAASSPTKRAWGGPNVQQPPQQHIFQQRPLGERNPPSWPGQDHQWQRRAEP